MDCPLAAADVLFVARQAVTENFDRPIAAARRLSNSRRPLSSLPPELIINIMHLVIHNQDTPGTSPVGRLHTLAQVSHRWWQLVVSSPSLWCRIDMLEGLHAVTCSLQKSELCLLDIYYDGIFADAIEQDQVLQEVGRCANRWKSLFIQEAISVLAFIPQLGTSTPHLEKITLKSDRPLHLAREKWPDAPHLRSITLTNINIPWTPEILSGLLSLTVTNVSDIPNPLQIVQVLAACPNIQCFVLEDWLSIEEEGAGARADVPSTSPRITLLSNLRVLKLLNVPCSMAAFILPFIDAHSVGHLEIFCGTLELTDLLAIWGALMESSGGLPSLLGNLVDGFSILIGLMQ